MAKKSTKPETIKLTIKQAKALYRAVNGDNFDQVQLDSAISLIDKVLFPDAN